MSKTLPANPLFNRSTSIFTSCYCEENVFKLCEQVKDNPEKLKEMDVVWISSVTEQIPVWNQSKKNQLTIWDYHVIAIHSPADEEYRFVYDLSSKLPFPTPLLDYCVNSFLITYLVQNPRLVGILNETRFRVLSASEYLESFSSDRSHMLRDGSWIAPPPEYPAIVQPKNKTGKTMNLENFKDMQSKFIGNVYNLEEFMAAYELNLDHVLAILKQSKI